MLKQFAKLNNIFRLPSILTLHWQPIVVGLLTLTAFLMRRKGLATQSLWFDEADLLARSQQSLEILLKDILKPGENGPLYTIFMHFWIQIAGTGEAALRTPSLIAGTATVPLIYLLGQKLAGKAVGLLAAIFVTISPYQIWYSQDAKMYPLAVFLTVGSILLFLTALERGGRWWWIGYVVLTTLSFYIHLICVLIVAVELFYYWLQPAKTSFRQKIKTPAALALALLTLPYLPIALWQGRALWDGGIGETWFNQVNLWDMLMVLGRKFSVNRLADPFWEMAGSLFYATLAILGGVVLWRQKNQATARLLSLYLGLPIIAFYILTIRIPLFADRYLLIASPAYYLIIAYGLIWLGRKAWPAAIMSSLIAFGFALLALNTYNYSETPQKEDWRESMRWLQTRLQPGDEIIVIPGYLKSAVDYYLKPGNVPIYTIPQSLLAGKDDPALNSYLSAEKGIIRGHERAWLITSPERYRQDDPNEYVRKIWFDNNTWLFADPKVNLGVTIYGYTFKQIPGTAADYYPNDQLQISVGNSLQFEGFDLRPSAALATTLPTGQVRYDSNLHLILYWRKIELDSQDYEVNMRLLDKAGRDTNTNFAAQPLAGYYPTSKWKIREAVRDYRDIYIHVPAGEYQLELSVYPRGKPLEKLTIDHKASSLLLPIVVTVLPDNK